ncbi:MAG TPA: hypothetical protein VJ831_09220, partial [Jatrophihabitantaceae bacterium]|nr:hypothetical protein [Jatrophihabitantaceae bacterium]
MDLDPLVHGSVAEPGARSRERHGNPAHRFDDTDDAGYDTDHAQADVAETDDIESQPAEVVDEQPSTDIERGTTTFDVVQFRFRDRFLPTEHGRG